MMSNHLKAVQTHTLNPSRPTGLQTTVPSSEQPPSTSILRTDTQRTQRTTTFESISPVIESPSAGNNVETCVICSVYCVYEVDFPLLFYCFQVLHCHASIVLLVLSYMFGNKNFFFLGWGILKELCLGHQNGQQRH